MVSVPINVVHRPYLIRPFGVPIAQSPIEFNNSEYLLLEDALKNLLMKKQSKRQSLNAFIVSGFENEQGFIALKTKIAGNGLAV